MKRSIDRAIVLLGTPRDYEAYLSIKISPTGGGCCCLEHCWPYTWAEIIETYGLKHTSRNEQDFLIRFDKDKIEVALECHESGPEIIVYISAATASLLLLKAVIDVILTILKAREKERKRAVERLTITARRYRETESAKEAESITIYMPLNEEAMDDMKRYLEKCIKLHDG